MAKHDELLEQGAREAPEPETAEQRTAHLGAKGAAGGLVAAGAIAAKTGGLAKVFIWLFAWHGAMNLWRLGGWIGIALVLVAVTMLLVWRSRRESR
jgi:hypothetical protein